MRYDVLTLFPQMIDHVLNGSIIGRARENGLIQVNCINIRDFSQNKHGKTDDYPYGGGAGMVMTAQPIFDCYESAVKGLDYKPVFIYTSPQGKVIDKKTVVRLSRQKHLIILCGHYEGVDERVIEGLVDEEISIGDYVLTGGEIPAMVLIDAISRMIPGVLSDKQAFMEESHFNGMLEYPQYTRPSEYNGKKVPEILLSGHHENIEAWRHRQALVRTYMKRPDMFEKLNLDKSLKEEIINNPDIPSKK